MNPNDEDLSLIESYIEKLSDLSKNQQAKAIDKNEQFGDYEIIKQIGFGGMGKVFLAERNDGQFKQQIAVKCVKF